MGNFAQFVGGAPAPSPAAPAAPAASPFAAHMKSFGPDMAGVAASLAVMPLDPFFSAVTISSGGTITLSKAHAIVSQAASSPGAASFISETAAAASAGHPEAIGVAKLLTLAQRLQVMGQYVSKYLGPTQGALVTKGLGMLSPMGIPVGTGRYDRALPLWLEQTVTAMIAKNKDPAQLRELAQALGGGT